MRKKLLNNNLTGAISKGGVLYRPGEILTLTKEQITQANLVSKLPRDFPFANWENMTARQQQQTISRSGLNPQAQWALLNSNVPLSVLDRHNQMQDEIETRASATKIAPSLMNAVAKATAAQTPTPVKSSSNNTPLQSKGLQQKLDISKEVLKNKPLGKASGSTGAAVAPNNLPRFYGKVTAGAGAAIPPDNTLKVPAEEKSIVPDSRDAMDRKKDKLWDKIETTAEKEAGDTLYPWFREKNPENMQPFPFPAAIPVIKDVPYPPNGEKACVFYTNSFGAAFKRQAEYQRKVLESLGYEVELIRTDNVDIFQREWNNMDPKTTTAVVISHCNGMSLMFEHGAKTNAISANGYNKDGTIKLPDISGLNGPEITALYLYACNAGIEELLAYKGTNVADAFRDLPNVDTVYAFDGSVGFGPAALFRSTFEPRLSHEQNYDDVFTGFKISEEYGVSGESGFLEYDSFD